MVTRAVAKTLHEAAGVICDGGAHPVEDPVRIAALQDEARQLDQLMAAALDAEVSSVAESESESESEAESESESESESGAEAERGDMDGHSVRAAGLARATSKTRAAATRASRGNSTRDSTPAPSVSPPSWLRTPPSSRSEPIQSPTGTSG